jgi:hypothetical protein
MQSKRAPPRHPRQKARASGRRSRAAEASAQSTTSATALPGTGGRAVYQNRSRREDLRSAGPRKHPRSPGSKGARGRFEFTSGDCPCPFRACAANRVPSINPSPSTSFRAGEGRPTGGIQTQNLDFDSLRSACCPGRDTSEWLNCEQSPVPRARSGFLDGGLRISALQCGASPDCRRSSRSASSPRRRATQGLLLFPGPRVGGPTQRLADLKDSRGDPRGGTPAARRFRPTRGTAVPHYGRGALEGAINSFEFDNQFI